MKNNDLINLQEEIQYKLQTGNLDRIDLESLAALFGWVNCLLEHNIVISDKELKELQEEL